MFAMALQLLVTGFFFIAAFAIFVARVNRAAKGPMMRVEWTDRSGEVHKGELLELESAEQAAKNTARHFADEIVGQARLRHVND